MIRKLDNGKYLVQLCFTIDGKRYRPSKTFNTKAECNVWVAEQRLLFKNRPKNPITVADAIDKYIELGDTLSPSTLKSYKTMRQFGFSSIMAREIHSLTDADMQSAINEESKRKSDRYNKTISPKTVKNEWGLLSTAIKYATGRTFTVRLPKRTKRFRKYPHPQEVIPVIKGTEIEIPCLMAMCLSLRMSEVRGARYCDIDGDYLTINQVKLDLGYDCIKEQGKTFDSNRRVKIPKYLLDLINKTKEGEYIVKLKAEKISREFSNIMKPYGYDLTFHSLRHIFASTGAMVGIEPLYLASFGGWNNTKVLEETYEELFDSEKKKAENSLCSYFNNLLITNSVTNKSL